MSKSKEQRRAARKEKKYRDNHRRNQASGFQPPAPPPRRAPVAEDLIKIDHPRYVLAHEIDPEHKGWCWVPKKVRGKPVQFPVDFQKYRYAKPLADWMGRQLWWNQPIPADMKAMGTWHEHFSQLAGRLAEGRISEYEFSTLVVEMAFAAIVKSREESRPAPAVEQYEYVPA
jgi:hypothetical protein